MTLLIIVLVLCIAVLSVLLYNEKKKSAAATVVDVVDETPITEPEVEDVSEEETPSVKPTRKEIKQRRRLKRNLAEGQRAKYFRNKFNQFEFRSI